MKWIEACTGYACPPEHSTPVQDVIVKVHSTLADTGIDLDGPVGMIIAAGLIIIIGGGLVAESIRYDRKK